MMWWFDGLDGAKSVLARVAEQADVFRRDVASCMRGKHVTFRKKGGLMSKKSERRLSASLEMPPKSR